MKKVWFPGDSCVLRGVINNKVWLAQSVIVVKDTPKETILCLLPGAQCAYPESYWLWRKGDYSAGTRWQQARSQNLALREFKWQTNRILMFLEPEKYYSIWLFWNHEADRFDCFYINFQLPYSRSQIGFDTLDLDLDIVIDPQYNWTWKDEDEYRDGIREGGIQQDWVKGIELAQPEVFDRIHNRIYPLDGSWTHWKPDPAWDTPNLPANWNEL